MTKFSILDLIRIPEGSDARAAIDNARDLASAAQSWGYHRYWVAEHHNIPGIASAATAIVLAHIAAGTQTIRVGAGGIMLPNHSPIIIAEQFGTLARLHPGRIDLGVGRADGSVDHSTGVALRRLSSGERFPEDIAQLQDYFDEEKPYRKVHAYPADGTHVPIWILGTSTYGAKLAAKLGLPYAFGSHLNPEQIAVALKIYREEFQPSSTLDAPYVMVGVNIAAAESDAEAQWLATTRMMTFTDLVRGKLQPSKPPIEDMDKYWSPIEKQQVKRMLGQFIVGAKSTVTSELKTFIARTNADEIIMVSDIHNHKARLRSHELAAQCMAEL